MPDDVAAEYQAYLKRFDEAVGPLAPGEFAKHQGRLIQKLSAEEFAPLYTEYMGLASHYLEGVDRGDTINDLVVKLIRDHAARLILTSPV
ncbi:MAG: hypothetical protein HS111_08000 [Kofleriaceae bacterium]|nr:hypothetical protein [Kofleriaceae bacterium]MCL4224735.1 hypothetical protein [Myxococcales bacterium]